ncbi:hypothetical protein GCM10018793_13950 [Streptomyces sulfonofaciens]|uniref:Uncharacterized protein n=1 Tax=Streptomyces sulfonofaciens TaxID=68272 RepID=A0A919FWY5_9ACTN|nr:hypothetical protein [Streptomyces sulfonofaciens]GHH73958.1 hypothetical protein GCM10018793_13950 [Streptomyces sulfonofaciens]
MGVMTPALLSLDTLVGFTRRREPRPAPCARLAVPSGMTAPLGCDTVAVPAAYGRRVLDRLPRVGCVYGDGEHWWWIVPSDSDVALEWPAPARYTAGALVPDALRPPCLIHRPDGSVPYTPPIPLYLALCGITGTAPAWSSAYST